MPPVKPSITIPKFEGTAQIPPDAASAPDAPMSDSPPQVGSPQATPAPVPSEADFLDAVRKNNENRAKKSAPEPESEPQKEEETPQKDTTPPIFKSKSDKPAESPADEGDDDEEEDEEPVGDFSDPLENDPVETPKPTKAKSMKDLRNLLKSERARASQLRVQKEELEQKMEALKSFEGEIENYNKLKERVKHLETYEQIFDIHNNPEFHAKYIAGAEQTTAQARQIAEQYGIKDPAFVTAAARITNRKQLNDFLKHHLKDELGVQDIRPYIFHLQGLEAERAQLEKTPEQAREVLSKLHRESEDRRVATVSKTIQERTSHAWNQITGYYSNGDNAVEEFKEKPGDPEHTARREAVLRRANEEYAKVMGSFTGLGIKDLPLPIAQTLAARFQLSEWTGEYIAQNKSLKQKVADLEKQLKEQTAYSRPSYNGTNKTPAGNSAEVPKGTDISAHVFNKARDKVNSAPAR